MGILNTVRFVCVCGKCTTCTGVCFGQDTHFCKTKRRWHIRYEDAEHRYILCVAMRYIRMNR